MRPVQRANAILPLSDPLGDKPHFEVLDGLRGIAAYCVILFHSFSAVYVGNGFLDVDLFFMLSGFVIAYAYRRHLVAGMSVRAFFLRRLVRLYPMIVVGVLLGVAVAVLHNRENVLERYPDRDVIRATVLALLLIPNFASGHLGHFIFPLNRVMWSLFFEFVANLVYATFARHMSKGVLAVAALVGLAGTVAIGPLGGPVTGDFLTGFPRILFGFCAGALIYELWSDNRLPKVSLGILPLAVIILAIANYPIEVRGLAFIPVAFLFSIVLILGANASPGPGERRLCSFLGRISYPIYLIHVPILYIAAGAAKDVLRSTPKGFAYVLVVAAVLVICTLTAYLLEMLYETPVRQWLGPVLLKPRVAIGAATS